MLRPQTTNRRPAAIDAALFATFAEVVCRASGIVLGPAKQGLVRSRLERLAAESGFADFADFLEHVSSRAGAHLVPQVVDLLTTNHTYFWREAEQFELLAGSVLPRLRARLCTPGSPRIWCAAASTGQEAWALAGLVHDATSGAAAAGCVLGSDLSREAITRARVGVYASRDAERLPDDAARRWLECADDPSTVRIGAALRPLLRLRTANLLCPAPVDPGSVDVVFCRNVMIYFHRKTRSTVARHLRRSLGEGGLLFVSRTERLPDAVDGFERVAPGVYRRRG